ncbi:MAG: anthranilate synthase component I family protein [Planctomycetes bacterium]|nr:anthranilate synthase component I family protein [Planctomycetota bacterium]
MAPSRGNHDSPAGAPLVAELQPAPDPVETFLALAHLPHCLFLDSALRHPELGRHSFVAADPFDFWRVPGGHPEPLDPVRYRLAAMAAATVEGLPPFQGGAAGLFAYDLNGAFERLPAPRCDEFQIPAMALGWYDVVVAFDHVRNRAWIISQGFPELADEPRRDRAEARLAEFRSHLRKARRPGSGPAPTAADRIARHELATQFATPHDPLLTSNFSAAGYRAAVGSALDYIVAGDIFQVNLAQRLLYPAASDALSLYLRLRARNPATFAGYFDLGTFQLASASPERFLSVRAGSVETRPIKGTRQRCWIPEADLFTGDDLRGSVKDRAENVMIVDLLRNDLSRVCCPESVVVTDLCRLEVYQYVQHLVSVVRGRLAAGKTNLDLLRAAFPGGSISGAPKIRAMEIIRELEPTARGAYCGSLGYLGFDGTLDLSILIRTITAGRGWWQLPVGGGIVAQSVPEHEYEETWHKAHGLLQSLH